MATESLVDLPLEILIHIFGLLDGRQIVRCSAVCTHFKMAIKDSVALQYRVELAVCGYEDRPYAEVRPANAAIALEKLRGHIEAWNELDWVETRAKIPNGRTVLSGGVLAVYTDMTLTCVQLPSRTRDIPFRMWTLENDLQTDGLDIAIDAPNNLLVLVSHSVDFLTEIVYAAVHLRTLSDNTPHPDALHPVLHSSDADQAFILGADTIQIMGYSLGIVRRVADVAVLEIWNWIDGRQMARLVLPNFGPISFAFLSSTSFVIPSLGLDVYRFTPDDPEALVTHAASFELSPLVPDADRFIELVPPRDVLFWRDDQGLFPNRSTLPVSPFGVADDSHCIQVHRRSRLFSDEWVRRLSFFIPSRLLSHFSMSDTPLTLSWESWSQDVHVHDLGNDDMSHRIFPDFEMEYVHGGRVVRLSKDLPGSNHSNGITLLDFNRKRAKRRSAVPPNTSIPEKFFKNSEPGDTNRDALMETNTLPVHVSSRILHWTGSPRLMCDEEHIILEEYPPTTSLSEVELMILTI